MRHIITSTVTFVDAVLNNLYIRKVQWRQIIKKIIVITTDINNLCTEILHHLHDNFEKVRMLSLPFT